MSPTPTATSTLPCVTGKVLDLDDYTFHVDTAAGKHLLQDDESSWQGQLRVEDGPGVDVRGRALVCKCFRGSKLSITIRRSRGYPITGAKYEPREPKLPSSCEYRANDKARDGQPPSVAGICQELGKLLFPTLQDSKRDRQSVQGAVLITGSTGSAKSQVARGLIYQYLTECVPYEKRRPHLVTFEDPIEESLTGDKATKADYGIDYTPRQHLADARSLAQVCKDALRQTPAVLYVGEVRTRKDWVNVMEFAGSGHLVVSTAHAGSLVEAMHRIFFAVEANTPAKRGHFAQRILAVVHQARIPVDGKLAILPAVWRRTSAGLDALVSDGLSSVIPHRPSEKSIKETSSLGRLWFAEQYLSSARNDRPRNQEVVRRCRALVKNAAKSDLQGI